MKPYLILTLFTLLGSVILQSAIYHYKTETQFLSEAKILSELSTASGPSATATATVTARVLSALSIVGQTPLDFGVIEEAPAGGRIIISPMSQRMIVGDVRVSLADGFAPADIRIHGQPNTSYTMHFPSSLVFTEPSGKGQLNVQDLRGYTRNLHNEGTSGRLDAQGTDTAFVGGTLIVPAGAIPGRYRGEVPVTLSY